jgi:YD repeat-containing protein
VQRFYTWASRTLAQNEQLYWDDMLRAGYAHGQPSLVMAVREMGKALFESADYAGRDGGQRLNNTEPNLHNFVKDLYETYLQRDPDQGGWDYWASQVPYIGHEAVRRAFDQSVEFTNYVVPTITLTGNASSTVTSLVSARLDPGNLSGHMRAHDAQWGATLLSLSGRADLDLGLGISYSSAAVWTRSGPFIYFDEDNGWPSPGFKLGFATIQEKYFDAQVGRNVYAVISSAGSRVELRETATAGVYEAADSSYLQVTENNSSNPNSLLLRTSDGTQMNYIPENNEWRCNQIKDRNGNYISVNYDWRGQITSVTDTLGRAINFNYDGNANLQSITQAWHRDQLGTITLTNETHTWATFGWGTTTIQPGFSGVALTGIPSGQSIPVLTMVGLPDGSYYKFAYTNWNSGQVSRVTYYASDSNPANDNHELNHTAFNYSAADDVTKLTDTRVAAENWTGINGVPSEVTTTYGSDGGSACWIVTPDNNVYKEFYGTGWQKGLAQSTELWDYNGTKQKWTTTTWTQDNTNVGYLTNPRATDSYVHDAVGNVRRTTIAYNTFNLPSGVSCSLPGDVSEYGAVNATPVLLRQSHTDYNLTSTYISSSRRLIGLPSTTTVYDPATASYVSKNTFEYDWGGEYFVCPNPDGVQHDGANFGSSFIAGRGNLSALWRWDVTDINNSAKAIAQRRAAYNSLGSTYFTRDALGHQTTFGFLDSFTDNVNHYAYAYPSVITDPDNNPSNVQYNYDLGVAYRVQGPIPAGQSQGAIQTSVYDAAGRTLRTTVANNGAYKRFDYGPNFVHSWASVNTVADEAYASKIFDGAGRAIAAASSLPNSTGGYSAVISVYDQMGRAIKQSNPTETDTAGTTWQATGLDTTQQGGYGWLYTQQTYDFKGRPLVTTNTDGTTKSASYSACGCAGGEIVTLTDEGTLVNGTNKTRQQVIYHDVFGRVSETKILNWDGTGPGGNGRAVYAATVNTYNARDQLALGRQYAGDDTSTTYQDTTMTYDGYGRLWKRHAPEQQVDANNSSSTDHTTYSYNADDTVLSVTDSRGVIAMPITNGRHLVTGISYAAPTGIPTSANVSYTYDPAGNRTNMFERDNQNNVIGSTSYAYDQLSRMTAESRYFNGLISSPTSGNYTINYGYNLAGEMTSITDPFGAQIGYNRDTAGRVISVTGSGYGSITTYASGIQYRSFGAQKSVTYGDGGSAATSYNARMMPSSHQLSPSGFKLNEQYQYYADGRLQKMTDLDDRNQDIGYPDTARHFSRAQSYDQVGRLTSATGSPSQFATFPYSQNFGYDAFNNTTSHVGTYYYETPTSDGPTFVNNRRQNWTYYADGHSKHTPLAYDVNNNESIYRDWTYDAAGQMVQVKEKIVAGNQTSTYVTAYDGDGQSVREYLQENPTISDSYWLRSTVLGGNVLTMLDHSGNKTKTNIDVDGLLTAVQAPSGGYQNVSWIHTDPLGLSTAGDTKSVYDPSGNYIPWQHAPTGPPNAYPPFSPSFGSLGSAFGSSQDLSCQMDGLPTSCDRAFKALARGEVKGGSISSTGNPIAALMTLGINVIDTNDRAIARVHMTTLDDKPFAIVELIRVNGSELTPAEAEVGFKSYEIDALTFAGVSPQKPTPFDQLLDRARQLHNQPNRNDCLALVDLIRISAKLFPNVISATAALGDVLTGSSSAYELAIRNAVNDMSNPLVTFGNNGFQTSFAGDPGDNQVRHFMGGLLVGETLGAAEGLPRMNARENPNIPGDVADINLNGVSLPLGDSLRTHNAEYGLNPGLVQGEKLNWLADQVRDKVCK